MSSSKPINSNCIIHNLLDARFYVKMVKFNVKCANHMCLYGHLTVLAGSRKVMRAAANDINP